jgi:hypothetical protein
VAHPQIAAFPRLAEANAKPTRAIAGQHTLITRTIHDMAYDPVRDEIVVPQFYLQGILTFRGSANGDEAPIRVISGPRTQIANPARIALDPVHNEIYIPMDDRLLVFARDAQGDVAPLRIIEGPDTQMSAGTVQVDPVNNLVIVGGINVAGRPRDAAQAARGQVLSGERGGRSGQLLIFDRTASGNAKPLRVIRGPNSKLSRVGLMAVYPPRKLIVVGVPDGQTTSPENFVGVWSELDNGDVPPRWMIGGPNSVLRQVRGLTLDPKNKNVIISDKYINAVLTFNFPEIF